MRFHGPDFKIHDISDFRQRHIFREPQQKNGPLLGRKSLGGMPNSMQCFARNQSLLLRRLWRSQVERRTFFRIFFLQPDRFPPECQPAIFAMIARQVNGDVQKPCADRALAAKAVALSKGAEEAILG